MKILNALSLLIISLMLLSYSDYINSSPLEISGRVVDSASGKPLEKVYVFTAKGEEEALTGDDGDFKLKTWAKAPILLSINHNEFHDQKIQITSSTQPLLIRLRKKLKNE